MLKMFPMIPTHDTERQYNQLLELWFIEKLTKVLRYNECYIYNNHFSNEYNHNQEVVFVYLGI